MAITQKLRLSNWYNSLKEKKPLTDRVGGFLFAKNLSYTVGIKDCFGYGHSVRWIAKVKRSGENLAWIGVTEIDFSKIIGGYQRGKGLFRIYGYSVRWIAKIKRGGRYSTLISIQWE